MSFQIISDEDAPQGIVKGNGVFICMSCGRQFGKKSSADRHFKTQHLPPQKATCHVCKKVFKNAVNRDTHRAKEHGITKAMMKSIGSVPKQEPIEDEE